MFCPNKVQVIRDITQRTKQNTILLVDIVHLLNGTKKILNEKLLTWHLLGVVYNQPIRSQKGFCLENTGGFGWSMGVQTPGSRQKRLLSCQCTPNLTHIEECHSVEEILCCASKWRTIIWGRKAQWLRPTNVAFPMHETLCSSIRS